MPNYAWRSYLGGSRLRAFRNDGSTTDDHFPEDWLASKSGARNGSNLQRPDEGVSHLMVDGRDVALTDLIATEPEWFWGNHRRTNH
jgi:mannose-6-phosphate isomerase